MPRSLLVLQMIKEELLDRTVIGAQHMANRPSADQMANFLRHVFHMVAGALNLLRHKQNMKAVEAAAVPRPVQDAER